MFGKSGDLIHSFNQNEYEETMQVETRKKWEQGMDEEMDSLVRNQTWDLVKLPVGKGHCRINGFTGQRKKMEERSGTRLDLL